MIVADAGPVIAFARIGRLNLLHAVVEELLIPDAVYRELAGRGMARPGAVEVAQAQWIQRGRITDIDALNQLPQRLHLGEREAIILAEERGLQLLIDEIRGRQLARQRGVETVGTLRILEGAKRLGLIEEVRGVLGEMLAAGYWISHSLILPFLARMGESETK